MEKKDVYKFTNPQRNIWSTEQFFSGTNINNVCGRANITEKVNFAVLKDAIQVVLKTNASFLIKFKMLDGEPVQYITPYHFFDIKIVDVKTENDVKELEKKLYTKIYKLEDNYLYDTIIYRFPNGNGGFFLNTHHILGDSWSLGLYCKKVIQAYTWLLENNKKPDEIDLDTIPDMASNYLDYCIAEKEYLSSPKFEKDKKYWQEKFETIPEIASLPSKNSNINTFSCKGNRLSFELSPTLSENINNYCKANNISTYNFLTAVYSIYISKCCNSQDFTIGTLLLNRTNHNEKNTTGMFLNTAPLRLKIDDNEPFNNFVTNIAKDSLGMLRHQKYPYQTLLEDLRKNNLNLPNLYNILISYQVTKTTIDGLKHNTYWAFNGNCADELQIHILDLNDTGSLNISYDYKSEKYTEEEINCLHKRIENIIEQVIKNSNILTKDVEILTPTEKEEIIYKFNSTKLDYNNDKTIVDLFEEQVSKTPDKPALTFGNQSLTYSKLNEKANQLANYLVKNGVNQCETIGIMVNRSLEMIIGLIAILKTGGNYLPIDPEYPLDRIDYMLENSKTSTLLVNESTSKLDIKVTNKISIDLNTNIYKTPSINNLNTKIKPDDLIYLIYTSGSTGKPKGVMLTHKNINNFLEGMKQNIDFSANKTMLSVTTVCFDIFVLECWGALTNGLELILASETEQSSPFELEKLFKKHNINMMQTTPSRYSTILAYDETLSFFQNLTDILVGGEPFPKQLLEKLQNNTNAKIFNMYGPTETAVWSTMEDLTNAKEITIGRPISNTTCYILDKNKMPLPTYIAGELYIGGDGVSNGYLNRYDLTKEKFIKSPFKENETIYNTGDLAYFTDKGEIVHLGRSDFQVKIRGYRIELSEIENRIMEYEYITNCVVNPIENATKLCAYYISTEDVDISDLRGYLAKTLPNYMVPNYFKKLDKIPHTPNGKIDRKALPLPKIEVRSEKLEARNNTELELEKLYKKVLNIEDFSIKDSFFDLGGDSLSAIKLSTIILKEFNVNISVKDIFENPTIEALAKIISSKKNINVDIIPKAENKEYYNASSAQKRIYFASKMDGEETILYNLPAVIKFSKKPDIQKINSCLKQLILRHKSLRTSFEIVDNEVKQKIENTVDFEMEIASFENETIDEIVKNFVKPFNLAKVPLFRACFVTRKNDYYILIDMHHIISDGMSLTIMQKELCDLYNNKTLQELSIDYTDFAEYEHTKLTTDELSVDKNYWIEQFKENIPVLNLPTDYQRPALQTYKGNKIYKNFSKEFTTKIKETSKNMGVSEYMLLLACYYILLSKYTSQEDIVVGSPVLGREKEELLNIIGMFVNTLPLKNKIDSSEKFRNFLNNLKQNCITAIEHSNYPFDELVRNLNLKRDTSQNPLFDTMFIFQNNPILQMDFDGIKTQIYIPNTNISKFSLSLEIFPFEDEYKLSFEYCTDLFKQTTIEALSIHFYNIVNCIVNNENIKIADIDMFSQEERNKILFDFNNTQKAYDKNKNIISLFEEQAKKTPDDVALIFGDDSLTYSELNKKSNSLAHYLRNTIGIKPNDIVGIMTKRSLETIVSMLAVLKSGGCYIPIDPSFPKDRINYMLENSNSKILLTQEKIANNINYPNKLCIDLNSKDLYNNSSENLKNINTLDDLMYIIYTSGSTGKPKGVMVTHRVFSNFTNYCNDTVKYLKNPSNMAFASITTISFDIFAYETLISLQKGLKVVLANENEQTTPHLLNKLMEKNNVEIIQSTPSIMQIFVNNIDNMPKLRNLKYVILAGEQLPLNLVKNLHSLADITVYNGYGPSETYYCTLTEANDNLITIGKPIYNSQMYILDKNLKPVPIGATGEIYISGECVGKGYLNNKELTDKSFIPNPFIQGITMYKSGDLGKYLEDGNIICLGRSDHQVKIRGLRIEIEEIEALMLKHPNISKVVVVKQSIENREFLSAYYVADKRLSTNDLRKYLSKSLPRYMVPSYYIHLNDLPYTPNGKIDRKALPIPKELLNSSKEKYVEPQTELQKQLVQIWEKVLNLRPIGINDNFFELGGDSLLAMTLNLELAKITDKITYQDIFRFSTVSEQEKLINSDIKNESIYKIDDLSGDLLDILNKSKNKEKIKKSSAKNILLTGVTGFLGAHIMEKLLEHPETKIYCIIREEPGLTSKYKLHEKLKYYFGEKYNNEIDKRIFAITGDICEPGFGLKQEDLLNLANSIDTVINSAANVSHFGNYNKFYNANVQSVKYIIDFCKSFNKSLYQISTMGVAGLNMDASYLTNKKKNKVVFDESSLYIGQEPETVYTYTKYLAEIQVLNAITTGLDGYILRMGNLMPRFSDGLFQENEQSNEFLNKIASFVRIGAIPDNLYRYTLEITPVDLAAKAICQIVFNKTTSNRIFHLFDYKRVPMCKCLKLFKKLDYNIEVLPEKDFIKKISDILEDDESKKILEYILNDFDENKHISYEANMKVKSSFTKKYLRKTKFVWPKISNDYMVNIFNILKKLV